MSERSASRKSPTKRRSDHKGSTVPLAPDPSSRIIGVRWGDGLWVLRFYVAASFESGPHGSAAAQMSMSVLARPPLGLSATGAGGHGPGKIATTGDRDASADWGQFFTPEDLKKGPITIITTFTEQFGGHSEFCVVNALVIPTKDNGLLSENLRFVASGSGQIVLSNDNSDHVTVVVASADSALEWENFKIKGGKRETTYFDTVSSSISGSAGAAGTAPDGALTGGFTTTRNVETVIDTVNHKIISQNETGSP